MLVNSHYHSPWIIWSKTHSITVPQWGELPNATLPHGLAFIPLLIGQWSTNANFSPCYDLIINTPGGPTSGQPETYCQVSADATNVRFYIINNASQRTFYFKLMAYAPPEYIGQVNPVSYNSPFRFNSHYRYLQIYKEGQASAPVNHGLGYLPQARIWRNNDNVVTPSIGILTTSTLSSSYSGQYYYHIYKDILDGTNK